MHGCGLLLHMLRGVYVWMTVCWAHGWAVQKWLNQSRCRLGGWLMWVQGTRVAIGWIHFRNREWFKVGDAVICQINLGTCVSVMVPCTSLSWLLACVLVHILSCWIIKKNNTLWLTCKWLNCRQHKGRGRLAACCDCLWACVGNWHGCGSDAGAGTRGPEERSWLDSATCQRRCRKPCPHTLWR